MTKMEATQTYVATHRRQIVLSRTSDA